jgi:hypothetical protein
MSQMDVLTSPAPRARSGTAALSPTKRSPTTSPTRTRALLTRCERHDRPIYVVFVSAWTVPDDAHGAGSVDVFVCVLCCLVNKMSGQSIHMVPFLGPKTVCHFQQDTRHSI